jgi:hypothetical protein
MGTISFDAVKHLQLCRIEQRPHGWIWRTIRTCPLAAGGDHHRRRLSSCRVRVDMDTPQVLLARHLKTLRLPTFLREHDKLAQQRAAEGVDFPRCLLRLSELELLDRERRATERRIRQAKVEGVKSRTVSTSWRSYP